MASALTFALAGWPPKPHMVTVTHGQPPEPLDMTGFMVNRGRQSLGRIPRQIPILL